MAVRTQMDQIAATIQWLGAPVVSAAISSVYFVKARRLVFGRRVAVSAHGALLLLIYLVAAVVHQTGTFRPALVWPFLGAFIAPALSILFALAWYRGNKALHLLILPLLYCGLWIAFIGGMAVTGDWL